MKRIHVASHSTRIRILHRLLGGDNYAGKLGQELNIERKVIAFHLGELEKVGLVEGKFALNQDKRPVAVKYYKMTPMTMWPAMQQPFSTSGVGLIVAFDVFQIWSSIILIPVFLLYFPWSMNFTV